MTTGHLWVYGTQPSIREYHLITSVTYESGQGWAKTGRAYTPCSPDPRSQFVTSFEPPEHLDLCDRCALADYDGWVVYRCYAADGSPLYVGVTSDLDARLRRHKNCKTYSSRWWPLLDRIEADTFESRYQAGAAERAAIRELQPRFNTIHKKARTAA